MNLASLKNGNIKLMSEILEKDECKQILLHYNSHISKSLRDKDEKLNAFIFDKVKNTNKYVECNSKYQVLNHNDIECDMYKYDMSTSCLDKNWILYICLNGESEILFDMLDIKFYLSIGSGILIQETDDDFKANHEYSHMFTTHSSKSNRLLVKRFF